MAQQAAMTAVNAVFAQLATTTPTLENQITEVSHDKPLSAPKGVQDMAGYKERVNLGIDEDGNEIVKWASGSSKKELHDNIVRLYVKYGQIDKFLAEFKRTSVAETETRKQITFADYADRWLAGLKSRRTPIKETTAQGYESYLRKHLKPEFGHMNLWEITVFDVQQYLSSRTDLTIKTLREHLTVLRSILDYAVDDDEVQLSKNPARSKRVRLDYSEKDSVVRDALPLEIVQQIIRDVADLPLRQRRLMALLLFTGVRRGEALGLQWEDLDFEKGIITVRRNVTYATNDPLVTTHKTENGFREIPLDPQLVELLDRAEDMHGYIVGGRSPITLMAYRWMFECIKKKVNLHDATAHIFRHSYLTLLDEAGVDPKTLQVIAGHSSYTFTMKKYVHGRRKAMLAAGKKFTQVLQKKDEDEVKEDNLQYSAEGS